jgi:TonB-linked SusC/RagA family outer membrane protein
MKQKLLSILLLCTLLVGTAYAQSRTISGTVTSAEDGSTLPGVSVTVQGSSVGTQTNANGFYTLSVPADARALVFSYLGFTSQTVNIGNSTTINVSLMSDAQTLEDVVVVGYGTTTKESFTGSAKVVSGADLERKSTADVSKALAGEVAGLQVINTSGQPGRAATIRIRGFGSVNGNRDPLYVVDGVPYEGGATSTSATTSISPINAINPADIESTTILKDAAATAIYGARGANGVIIITTRSGKGKASFVEVDGNFGSNMSLLPRYDVIRSPEQYIGLSWEALYNQGASLHAADPVKNPQDGTAYANQRLFSSAGISPNNNLWNFNSVAEFIDPVTRTVNPGITRKFDPENWEDFAFQASNRSEVNVKFGGSNDKTNYYSSIGYLKDNGYSIKSDFERLSARLNVNHDVKSWLTTSMNFGYSRTETNNGGQTSDSGSIFWFVDNMPSIYPLFMRDKDGNYIPDPIFGGNRFDYGETGRKFGSLTNAIADATFNTDRHNRNELNGSGSINFRIIDGLTFENRLGIQYFNNKYVSLNNKYYGSAASQNGSIYQQRTETNSYNLLNLLRYSKDFGDHNFEALAAHESTSWKSNILSVSAFNLVDPNLEDFNNAIVSNPISSYTNAYTLESYFAQVNYDYQNKYFLSGSIRRDGSSRFVKNKWGNFGSVGAAWLISNEEFMQTQNTFSSLKLKASYGLIGEQAGIGYYPGYDLYDVNNLNDNPAFAFYTKGNPDLTWETSRMFQTGVEFSLGRYLSGAIDYYVKNTTDLIFDRRVGPSIGYALIKVNDGELRNQGLEFDLTGHIIKTDRAFLNLTVNGELLKNKITKMPIEPATGEPKILDIQGNYGWSTGHSIYDFYMRNFEGVDPQDGKSTWTVYQDANGANIASLNQYLAENPSVNEGSLTKTTTKTYANATQYYVGKSAIPKMRGAFNLSSGYDGFSLSVQMLYSFGGYAYDGAYARLMSNDLIGGNNWSTDIMNRWQKPGDITDVPRVSNNADANVASASTRFLTKSNYLALNNIRLGYEIPASFLSGLNIGGASVWVSADNLWIHSARKGFNPSTSEAGSSDMYRYSPLSTVSGGIRVKF